MAIIPGTNVPSSVSGTGSLSRGTTGLLEGHIFNAGLEKPDILPSLIVKFPQYYLLSLTDKIAGGAGELFSNTHAWNVQDRTRRSASVTTVTNGTTATATLTLDIADGTGDEGYFLVGDIIRVGNSGETGRVTAVSAAGGFQTIDVVRSVGGNWTTALLPASGSVIGHIATGFAEGSSGSGGFRTYLPTQDYNVTSILRRGFKVSRDAMAQKTWIDDKTWQFKNEDFEQKEFMRDVEALALFGKRFKSSSLQGVNQTRGLMEYAEGSGQTVTFASSVGVQESDWQQLLQSLYNQNGSNDLIALCGRKILFDTQNALADRYRAIPNAEKPAELAGLNFQSYEIAGKRIHFSYYEMFSDTAILPTIAPSSTAKDFENLALVLDFQNIPGAGRNVQMKYRSGAKMVQKFITGMASPQMEVSNAFDGMQGELLTEFMPVCYQPNKLGLIYANS
jgi:hypothetical protein